MLTILMVSSPGYERHTKFCLEELAREAPNIPVNLAWFSKSAAPAWNHPKLMVVIPKQVHHHGEKPAAFNKSYALNVLLKQATTDWVMIADADMLFSTAFFNGLLGTPILNQTETLPTRQVYRFFCGRLSPEATAEIFYGKRTWEGFYSDYQGRARKDFTEIYGTPNPCIYYRKELLELRGYDESFSNWGGEDDDLTIRGRQAGLKDVRLPLVVGHLYHAPNSEFATYRNNQNALKVGTVREINPNGFGD